MIWGCSRVFLGEGVDVGEEREEGDNGDKSGGLAGIMDVIFEWDGL